MKTSQDGWMMNLFCFTLDGSTDSLYEPTQSNQKSQDPLRSPKMPSTKCRAVWRGSEPCIATASASTCREAQKLRVNEIHLEKARRKSQAITALDEASDHKGSHDIHCPTNKEKDALVHSTNDSNTVTLKDQCRSKPFTKEEEDESVCSVKTGKDSSIQGVNFEAWNPYRENCDGKHQDKCTEGEEEGHGTLKRIHKLVGVKKGTQCDIEESRNNPNNRGQGTESESKHHSPVITCISMTKKPEKKLTKGPTPQPRQSHHPHQRKEAEIETEASWSPLLQESWSPMIYSPAWDTSTHTCHRSAGEQVMYNFNFTLPRDTDRERYEELFQRLDPHKREPQMRWITHSVMDLDVPDHLRSTSFGIFDRQHPTHDKAEDKKDNPPVEAESHEVDSGKTGSLGKKMKNISLTMRKKMGRKYTKALSEETGEEPASGEAGDGSALAKYNSQSSNSVESLFSLHSGQSSSSGVTSSSDGYSNRDSLRLEEDVPYTGQFCGRAKVHTDFVPSPYDTESLKLKVGDVIDIISKPAMGIWTGMLNNKVGSFKFIYVDVLVEESVPQPRIRSHRRSRRPRPKTLQEFLERLNLEEHISSLLLNGYQTVDDLRDLKEQHLIELNVTDPEHRHRLMAAAENLQDTEYNNQIPGQTNEEPKSPSEQVKEELKDCPRDSGCYIGSDCSENSKEDTENQLASHRPPTANP